jgi:hypothetical protein
MESSLYLYIRRVIKQIVEIIETCHFVNNKHDFIQHPAVKFNFARREIIAEHDVDFDATGHLPITYSALVKYLKKMRIKMK